MKIIYLFFVISIFFINKSTDINNNLNKENIVPLKGNNSKEFNITQENQNPPKDNNSKDNKQTQENKNPPKDNNQTQENKSPPTDNNSKDNNPTQENQNPPKDNNSKDNKPTQDNQNPPKDNNSKDNKPTQDNQNPPIDIPKDPIKNLNQFINKLNRESKLRNPKYILFFDYTDSDVCTDKNAYLVFKYFLEHNFNDAYYVINDNTILYKELLSKNEIRNIIPYNKKKTFNYLYPYFLHSKIIVQSYALSFQNVINKVKYLKLLYLTHAINYFKEKMIKVELEAIKDKKRKHIILSSPYEYNIYKKMNLYEDSSLHIAGLPRFDRFEYTKKNESERDCILISFTYRKYDNSVYQKSLYKQNVEKLLSNKEFISFLKNRNIDLIYSQHHHDVIRNRPFKRDNFSYVKYCEQNNLAHYIEQCSLYVTDFSTVSFDFMFQNKPVLFYFIDAKDPIKFEEKEYMKIDANNSIYFENVFDEQEPLIENIQYYINNNYKLKEGLKMKYESLFYTKKNITGKIYDIINQMIGN